MDDIFFLVIGNFLTCAFSRNFTAFDLLRRPLSFKLNRERNFLVTKIPKGIPWADSILKVDKFIATKVRDIPVQKGLKEIDKNTDMFIVDISFFINSMGLTSSQSEIQTGELTYSPWYRFVNEPYKFDLDEKPTAYVAQAVAYVLKTRDVKTNIETEVGKSFSTVLMEGQGLSVSRVEIEGKDEIAEIRLIGKDGMSVLKLKNKTISLYLEHSRLCYQAIEKAEKGVFENVRLTKYGKNIELSYE